MNTTELMELIAEMLHDQQSEGEVELHSIRTFQDAGIMTTDEGIVVKLEDDSEFHITVQQTR